MKQRSGMPYDVVAFSTDENAILWTLEEEGAFHRLMRHAWVNGSVPDNAVALASICKCSVEQMEKMWPALEKSWPRNEKTGRRTNPKQEQERKFLKNKAKQNAENAKKRWGDGNATAMRPHSERNAPQPNPTITSPSEKKEAASADARRAPLSDFMVSSLRARHVEPVTDGGDWKQFDKMLKATRTSDVFTLENLQQRFIVFLNHPDFLRNKGHPIRYFSANVSAYSPGGDNGTRQHNQNQTPTSGRPARPYTPRQ